MQPRDQNIDKTQPGPINRHLKQIAQTITKSIPADHSPANATHRPKHRQNTAWPGQPTPGKRRPNHPQKYAWRAFPGQRRPEDKTWGLVSRHLEQIHAQKRAWRAFPGQRHPEAKTSTKHSLARSADTCKKSPKSSPKHAWRAFPSHGHPKAKESTKHSPTWSADT